MPYFGLKFKVRNVHAKGCIDPLSITLAPEDTLNPADIFLEFGANTTRYGS
jgi:hypothetical protein